MAKCEGGQHTVAASAAVLSSDTNLYRQITVRSNTGNAVCYFGDSNVTAVPANAHGFLKEDESYTFGPFEAGGIQPSTIYFIGTAGNVLFWNAVPL
jgi:hypothetical protein